MLKSTCYIYYRHSNPGCRFGDTSPAVILIVQLLSYTLWQDSGKHEKIDGTQAYRSVRASVLFRHVTTCAVGYRHLTNKGLNMLLKAEENESNTVYNMSKKKVA